MNYYKALGTILDTDPQPINGMTREVCEGAIKDISEMLKGPLPNEERLILVAERKDLRDTLAKMK